MNAPVPPRIPVPPVQQMSNTELAALVQQGHAYRGQAVFELADRAAADDDGASKLGELSQLPLAREDRLFHRVSLAWAAIISLLAAETGHSRAVAYEAFGALSDSEQADLLDYLSCQRIEDAHPQV